VIVATVALQGATAQNRGATGTKIVVSGCIMQAQRAGSLADDSGAGTAATPNSAPVDANTAEPVDAYLLTNATPVPDEKRATPTSYTLQGRADEVATHKGHRVEVTGQLLPPRPKGGTGAATPNIERIAVASVKMLSAECPVKEKFD
jgi:hypothetical protein